MLRGSECRVLAPGDALADEGAGGCDNNARLLILGVAYGGAGGAEAFDEAAYRAVLDGAAALMRAREPRRCMVWNFGWPMAAPHAALFDGRVLEYGSCSITMCNLPPLWQLVNAVHSVRSC